MVNILKYLNTNNRLVVFHPHFLAGKIKDWDKLKRKKICASVDDKQCSIKFNSIRNNLYTAFGSACGTNLPDKGDLAYFFMARHLSPVL